MDGYMCYPCLLKDYYAISADNSRLIIEIERLRGLMKAFVYQWEQDEIGRGNGTDYFNTVHAIRGVVRSE